MIIVVDVVIIININILTLIKISLLRLSHRCEVYMGFIRLVNLLWGERRPTAVLVLENPLWRFVQGLFLDPREISIDLLSLHSLWMIFKLRLCQTNRLWNLSFRTQASRPMTSNPSTVFIHPLSLLGSTKKFLTLYICALKTRLFVSPIF